MTDTLPTSRSVARATVLFSTLLAAVLLLLPLAGCGGEPEAASGEPVEAIVEAPLAVAERSDIPRRVEIQGTVEADRTASVAARVMAQVTRIRVAAGDPVTRGQALLEIDPQSSRGQVSQAEGTLTQARAQLSLADRNYRRFQALLETDAASQLEVDQARTEYEQARGAVERARGAVTSTSAVASDTTLRAPFDGRVVRRLVEVGDLAAPGRPLLLLQGDSGRRLTLEVPESLVTASGLAVGDRVPFTLDNRPDLGTLDGRVVEMSPGADPLSGSFEVKVALPAGSLTAAGSSIPTGVTGRGLIPAPGSTAVTVPADAVLPRGGMELVVIRDADGRARTRVVTTGARFERSDGTPAVEILSGLAGGETVLRALPATPPSGARVREAAIPRRPAETRSAPAAEEGS